MSSTQFALLNRQPLERYAALAQDPPVSETHHHAYPGGMLDYGPEIVAYALKLSHLRLLPVGTTRKDQAAQAEVWTAATAYAALPHNLGKIAANLNVELAWHPWHDPLNHPCRFRYRDGRAYRLHCAAMRLRYTQVLDTPILDWLSDHREAWSSLLYVLAGQYEDAGTLSELVVQADQVRSSGPKWAERGNRERRFAHVAHQRPLSDTELDTTLSRQNGERSTRHRLAASRKTRPNPASRYAKIEASSLFNQPTTGPA